MSLDRKDVTRMGREDGLEGMMDGRLHLGFVDSEVPWDGLSSGDADGSLTRRIDVAGSQRMSRIGDSCKTRENGWTHRS